MCLVCAPCIKIPPAPCLPLSVSLGATTINESLPKRLVVIPAKAHWRQLKPFVLCLD